MLRKRGRISTRNGRAYERVEFHAKPGWIARVTAAARALGLSRSAYIRLAVAIQLAGAKQSTLSSD